MNREIYSESRWNVFSYNFVYKSIESKQISLNWRNTFGKERF